MCNNSLFSFKQIRSPNATTAPSGVVHRLSIFRHEFGFGEIVELLFYLPNGVPLKKRNRLRKGRDFVPCLAQVPQGFPVDFEVRGRLEARKKVREKLA